MIVLEFIEGIKDPKGNFHIMNPSAFCDKRGKVLLEMFIPKLMFKLIIVRMT
jgi:hypothetical protein